jgi:peptide deformylase
VAFARIDRFAAPPYVTRMAKILPLVLLPDPLLRQKSAPIERVDDDLQQLIDDMFATMRDEEGLGLAAIQVGVPRRLLVLEMPGPDGADGEHTRGEKFVMINPQILTRGTTMRSHEEGCLSIPEVRVEIERPATLRVRYMDETGKTQERDAEGLLATAIQHEIDHLDGKLIIDFLSRLKRDMIIRRFKKMARGDT